jgi:hypothetical protein
MVDDRAALPNWTALSQPRGKVSLGQRVKQDRSTEMGRCFFERPDVAFDSLISRLRPHQSGSDVVEDQLGSALGLRLLSLMGRAEPWLFCGVHGDRSRSAYRAYYANKSAWYNNSIVRSRRCIAVARHRVPSNSNASTCRARLEPAELGSRFATSIMPLISDSKIGQHGIS